MNPRTKAAAAAADLLQRHRIAAPPVPVRKLAELEQITIVERPFDGNVSGMLVRKGPRAVIGVNPLHAETRQRFTIAHELDHYFLHPNRTKVVDEVRRDFRDGVASLGIERGEIDANAFAAELLMPQAFVTQAHSELTEEGEEPETDLFVSQLANRFDVSVEAMSYRLYNLGLSRQI